MYRIAIWILLLSFLSVGLRNFEPGISGDGPLFATIARTMVRTGEWFRMDGQLPDFVPFVEHPHLGYWILAGVFKILPAEDWAARIPSHLFYVGFLMVFYFYLRRLSTERTATWAVLLLWVSHRFTSYYTHVYLDPACLFLGTVAVVALEGASRKWGLGALAGLAFALGVMNKGLAMLGFGPALCLLACTQIRKPKPLFLAVGTAILVGGVYTLAVLRSEVPDFFSLYWARQMTARFSHDWQWRHIPFWDGWKLLFIDTAGLILLVPLSWKHGWEVRRVLLPWSLFLGFTCMYAGSTLARSQYWITVLPWIAWLVADGVSRFIPWHPSTLRKISGALAVAGVLGAQYIPMTVHGYRIPEEIAVVRASLSHAPEVPVVLEVPDDCTCFICSAAFAWYGDLKVRYVKTTDVVENLRTSSHRTLYFYARGLGPAPLHAQGFCRKTLGPRFIVWELCPS